MEIVYKFISDKLIATHQLLNLQQSDMRSLSAIDSDSEFEIEEIKKNWFKDIEEIRKSSLLDEDIDFIFTCINQYNDLEYNYREHFLIKLKFFFTKNAEKDIFLHLIENILHSNSSQCIEDFSRILLSSICLKPELVTEYDNVSFPGIAIDLMNVYPQITFPSLICLFSKTLHEFNPEFFSEIKKLLEASNDPYFYGMAIYRFAELAQELSQIYQLISPLDLLLSKNVYEYYLKILARLSLGNHHIAFFNAFKTIFRIVNWQFLDKDKLCFLNDEDILNCLLFIKQFSLHVRQIPRLCQEINLDTICHFLCVNDCDMKIRLNSLAILANLFQNEHFQNPDSIPFLISNIERISRDLPFSLKSDALAIYSILADIIYISDLDLLITDFFIDFLFQFFGSEDAQCTSIASNICKTIALKSPQFADLVRSQLSVIGDMTSVDESIFQLYQFLFPNGC